MTSSRKCSQMIATTTDYGTVLQYRFQLRIAAIHVHVREMPKQRFRATVCKTVRPVLSDRCLSCLSVLSVTFVHRGQTVGRIKMKLGKQVGLGPGHNVLDGDPAFPPPKGHSPPPNFRPISVAAKCLHGSRCQLAWI